MEKRYKFGEYFMWVLIPILFGWALLLFLTIHEGKFNKASDQANAKSTAYVQMVSNQQNI